LYLTISFFFCSASEIVKLEEQGREHRRFQLLKSNQHDNHRTKNTRTLNLI